MQQKKKFQELIKTKKKLRKISFHIIQFTDSSRFMASSLSNLVDSISEGIYKIKYKPGNSDKKCETCRIKYKHCVRFPEYKNFNDGLIE